MIDRLIQAAEAWGRSHYGCNVSATPLGMPSRDVDGTTTVDMKIEPGDQEPARQVHCFVTLEPDGTISCFVAGQE